MKNAKIIEALNVTINGLSMLRDELANADNTAVDTKAVAEAPMNPPVDDTEVSADSIDIEALKKMKYNEFKKYASQLGVDCKGKRDEIMERIEALGVIVDDGDDDGHQQQQVELPIVR